MANTLRNREDAIAEPKGMGIKAKISTSQILSDLKSAAQHRKPWREKAMEDYGFRFGDQLDDKYIRALRDAGVHALIINKIGPFIDLLSGIQRQNRTDYKAFPEGEEDSLTAEIATYLLKNLMKVSRGELKLSEMNEDAMICGEGYIDPYQDFTFDLLNGKLQIEKLDFTEVFPDPKGKEYDLSDKRFMIKLKRNLTKDQLKEIFTDPKQHKIIDSIENGSIDIDALARDMKVDEEDYDVFSGKGVDSEDIENQKDNFDLIEYEYKHWAKKFIVVSRSSAKQRFFESQEEAEQAINDLQAQAELQEDVEALELLTSGDMVILERMVPEMRIASMIGQGTIIEDELLWTYPEWKSFSIVPQYAHRTTVPIKKRELMIQGVVRGLRDPQIEINKRKTQKLRHLNSSTNSGWYGKKGAFGKGSQKVQWKNHGSSPAVILEYEGNEAPIKITPTPLSEGHARLEIEATNDFKEISGMNIDLLAQNEKNLSGRAISLRQKQGMVIVQKFFDNAAETKKILGQLLLSQLGKFYTRETALRVLGEKWVQDNFKRVEVDAAGPVIDEEGNPVIVVDREAALTSVEKVLNDASIGVFDVSIGEVVNTETIKLANFEQILDMVKEGLLPNVPGVIETIVDESLLDNAQKEKLKDAITQAPQPGQ